MNPMSAMMVPLLHLDGFILTVSAGSAPRGFDPRRADLGEILFGGLGVRRRPDRGDLVGPPEAGDRVGAEPFHAGLRLARRRVPVEAVPHAPGTVVEQRAPGEYAGPLVQALERAADDLLGVAEAVPGGRVPLISDMASAPRRLASHYKTVRPVSKWASRRDVCQLTRQTRPGGEHADLAPC
jgi:hypothetical protein